MKLLCLTARAASRLPSTSLQLFFGLKHSGKYREEILENLWNFQSFDLRTERNFNRWLSNTFSSCSICCLIDAADQPWRLVDDRSDVLFECSICQIRVHRLCYENLCLAMNIEIKDDVNDVEQSWKCQRCSIEENVDDRCTACLLRGGLLIQNSSHSFIHAICSIAEVYSPPSKKRTCLYCSTFCPLNYRKVSSQIFVSCQHEKCSQTFHLTCGLINGCFFSFDQEKLVLDTRCHLHVPTKQNDEEKDIVEPNKRVPNGTRVLLENKIGQVLTHDVTYHYSVDFGDDTFSNDMLPEDILDSNPTIGSTIRIRWTDGTIYSCKYLGRKRVLLYRIQLDRDIRQVQRHEFSLVDVRPPSPPPTPSQTESESTSTSTSTKRSKEQKPLKAKRRCCRLLLSSSSSSSSEDES